MSRAPGAVRTERPPRTDGGTVELAAGVLRARMPLPYALDHVNLWSG